jgi:rod shape-determining protein MreD
MAYRSRQTGAEGVVPHNVWTYRALLVALVAFVIFVGLLPLGQTFAFIPTPDLIMCLLFAWVIRRPDYVPMVLVAVVGFFADALLMHPLGLWTLIFLVATEYLRRSIVHTEVLSLGDELLQVATVMAASFFAYGLTLALLMADRPPITAQALHMVVTFVFYLPVVGLTQGVFGVRRLQPGEVDILGSRA